MKTGIKGIGHFCLIMLIVAGAQGLSCSDPAETIPVHTAVSSSHPGNTPLVELDRITIAKWHNNHAAAISLNYDSGGMISENDRTVQGLILTYGLHLDYELVTADLPDWKLNYILSSMIPDGFTFFGHGHRHINHDVLSYEQANDSFRQCYETMVEIGLTPVVYAYPGGMGYTDHVRKALADAGFLSGRMHHTKYHKDPYIVPDDVRSPDDWYELPTLVMQDITDAPDAAYSINDTEELIPYLDETLRRGAWLICTYHGIGDGPGTGHYKMPIFTTDLREIQDRDFWVASINDATLYVREREHAEASID